MPTAHLRVWRGGDEGEYVEYDVDYEDGMVVLDIVHRLQATQAPDLAVRWNCKAGKCGSCSAEVNGHPRLMCMTRMNLYDENETLSIAPMKTFPLITDLVVDVSHSFRVADTMPEFAPAAIEAADGMHRMSQIDVERAQEFHKCIECFLCIDVCHVVREHAGNMEGFAGPRFFAQLAQVGMHPRGTNDRAEIANPDFGLGYCNITKCCTEVCPESIHLTDNAIIPLKEREMDLVDPLRWLGRKLTGKD